jgi:hypothetical protein
MNDPVTRHDEKNAWLFLEMFPELLKTVLSSGEGPGTPGYEELIDVFREKVAVLKNGATE